MIPLAAVLGDPVAHSLSPRLHGYWLRKHMIQGHYIPLHLRDDDLVPTLKLLPRLGFVGANVTLPHKKSVLHLADQSTELARRVGSANTLIFRDGKILADNTDVCGFTWNILDRFPDWRPKHVLLLGAGGASRAVVVALQDQGATRITVTNRNPARAIELAKDFGLSVIDWDSRHDALPDCDTLINATSLGMAGQPPLDLDIGALPKRCLVTDLVYTPLETPLLAQARAAGHPVVDGLGMLLHQAVPGFEAWFGLRPAVDDALRQEMLR